MQEWRGEGRASRGRGRHSAGSARSPDLECVGLTGPSAVRVWPFAVEFPLPLSLPPRSTSVASNAGYCTTTSSPLSLLPPHLPPHRPVLPGLLAPHRRLRVCPTRHVHRHSADCCRCGRDQPAHSTALAASPRRPSPTLHAHTLSRAREFARPLVLDE